MVGADLPSQPAECCSAHLQSSEVGNTERFGSKQLTKSKGTQQMCFVMNTIQGHTDYEENKVLPADK